MHEKAIELFARKLTDALNNVDGKTLAEARSHWKDVGPAPACPCVTEVLRKIHQVLAQGHADRERAAKELVEETVFAYSSLLSTRFIEDMMKVVEGQFSKDHYVQFAANTEGVYQRATAPSNKFNGRALQHELSLIRVGAANNATQAVSRLRTLVEDAQLRQHVKNQQVNGLREKVMPNVTFNGPVNGPVTVAGETVNNIHSTVLNLTIGEIEAKIDASSATPAEKEEAKSLLGQFLAHPLVVAVVGGIAGGLGGY